MTTLGSRAAATLLLLFVSIFRERSVIFILPSKKQVRILFGGEAHCMGENTENILCSQALFLGCPLRCLAQLEATSLKTVGLALTSFMFI